MKHTILLSILSLFITSSLLANAAEETESKPLTYEATYKFEGSQVTNGGAQRGGGGFGNLDAKATADLEKLWGWKGGVFHIYGLGVHGKDMTEYVGDRQGTSNIEAPMNTFKIYEAWLQQSFHDDKGSVLLGLSDLNREFYATSTSGGFLNSSFGVGHELAQTGTNGPSIFPATAPALRLSYNLPKNFNVQAAVFNGEAGDRNHLHGTHARHSSKDGYLQIAELAYIKDEAGDQLASKYSVGTWKYTKQDKNDGYYILVDQQFSKAFSAFLRYGVADKKLSEADTNISTGLVVSSFFPGSVGIGYTEVTAAKQFMDDAVTAGTPIESKEATTEIYYRYDFECGLGVQPDIQFVSNPSFSREVSDATVVSLRLQYDFDI